METRSVELLVGLGVLGLGTLAPWEKGTSFESGSKIRHGCFVESWPDLGDIVRLDDSSELLKCVYSGANSVRLRGSKSSREVHLHQPRRPKIRVIQHNR
jgi:hypothetical protein